MSGDSARRASRTGVVYLYRELWQLARGSRHLLLSACVLLVGAQCILLAAPYFAGKAINALQLRGVDGLGQAGMWLSCVLGLAVMSWMLHGPGRILERNVSLLVRRRISNSLVERLLGLPLSWHESHHSAATAHRIQQSSHALTGFAQSQYVYLNSAVRLVGPVVALWCIEPIVGMTAIAGFAVICASVTFFDRAMMRLARQENDAERQYNAALVDTLGNTTTLFALRQTRGVTELLERRLLAVFAPLRRSILLNEWKWCTVDLATRALSCGLVALFAWRVARDGHGASQALLLGSLYMVWEYAVQSGGVVASVAQHFQTFARQNADYASADAIRDAAPAHFSDKPPMIHAPDWQRLDLHQLTFRHPASRAAAPSLDRVSLSLQRGKRYALIGDSGCGKSTLLRVLAGLYAAERCTLTCDSRFAIVAPDETARFLRSMATLIPQDAEVFAGTLAENLGLCESVQGPPQRHDFAHALSIASADTFLDASPSGLEVSVAERAANWSGGQRSRIALARGVLAARGSSIVLLDEPTAHLDPSTEAQVYARLFAEFADACLISSVHRMHLLEHFDEVIVMEDGRVIAQGPPAELGAARAGARAARESRPGTTAH
ncbi:MAG TPA: ABC transporter ATP-binding protein [Steroidobacteraceae bacterium]|nr:ABC transporter ATP-binding protein [Steroidobacteraceae bacterium]